MPRRTARGGRNRKMTKKRNAAAACWGGESVCGGCPFLLLLPVTMWVGESSGADRAITKTHQRGCDEKNDGKQFSFLSHSQRLLLRPPTPSHTLPTHPPQWLCASPPSPSPPAPSALCARWSWRRALRRRPPCRCVEIGANGPSALQLPGPSTSHHPRHTLFTYAGGCSNGGCGAGGRG